MAKSASSEKRKVPRVSDLILQVIAQCKSQGGITMVELRKALTAAGYDVTKNQSQVNRAMRGLMRTETLLKTSSKGALQSFKFNTKVTVFNRNTSFENLQMVSVVNIQY